MTNRGEKVNPNECAFDEFAFHIMRCLESMRVRVYTDTDTGSEYTTSLANWFEQLEMDAGEGDNMVDRKEYE